MDNTAQQVTLMCNKVLQGLDKFEQRINARLDDLDARLHGFKSRLSKVEQVLPMTAQLLQERQRSYHFNRYWYEAEQPLYYGVSNNAIYENQQKSYKDAVSK